MLSATDISVLLATPAGSIREHALRALPRLADRIPTVSDRWLIRVVEGKEAALEQLRRCSGVEFWPVVACAWEHSLSSREFRAGGELFPAFHFEEDRSVLWNARLSWRAARSLTSGEQTGDGALWHSPEPVLLRLASDEELDDWEARSAISAA